LLKRGLNQLFFLLILSFLVGSASSIFLKGLEIAQNSRNSWQLMWFLLPAVGILFQFFKSYFPNLHHTGTNDYVEIVQQKEKKTSAFFSGYILLATWISHLAGASVGREGTAVQIGASFSEQLSHRFNFTKEEKSIWLRAGMSAGFASVFGTPFAGVLFGLEVSKVGEISWKSILPCLASAFFANFISLHVYDTNHIIYPAVFLPTQNIQFWANILFIGLFLGLIGFTYKALESNIYKLAERMPKHYILKGIISGLFVYLILQTETFKSCVGLGTEKLLEPFTKNNDLYFFIKKLFTTALSLGVGYKGGEATPLFLIGAHAGATFSNFSNLPIELAAAIGFVALYAGLAKTPLTGMMLGIELFTFHAWFIYLICTIIVIYTSGKKGLFATQNWSIKLPKPLY